MAVADDAGRPGSVRRITRVSRGTPASDGASVRLTRMLGNHELPDLDPFLLLDQIRSDERDDYIAGFPDHPHRGFETVTIMLDGRMRHGDSLGNRGVIEPGGVQWMTAGRGIVHSEIPEQEDGRLWGFQLWINLPATEKMTDPRYQEFSAGQIPVERRSGALVRVIAGTTEAGTVGPAQSAATAPVLLDVQIQPDTILDQSLPFDHAAFMAVYRGSVTADASGGGAVEVHDPDLAVFSAGDSLRLCGGPRGAALLIAAGRPLNEPVARFSERA